MVWNAPLVNGEREHNEVPPTTGRAADCAISREIMGTVQIGMFSEVRALQMQFPTTVRISGERGRIRTCDPCLKRALLYQLSYAPALDQFSFYRRLL